MPEGPEVETVRRSLAPLLVGRVLGRAYVSAKALREPTSARALRVVEGHRVAALDRHGKLLFVDSTGNTGLLVRLGMSGRVVVTERTAPRAPHTHVVIPLDDGALELRYVDPRRFGSVLPYGDLAAREAARADLGPDGLTITDVGRAVWRERVLRTTRALKDVLLDQAIFAGVGNIYASEALHLAKLSPFRSAASLKDHEMARLVHAVPRVLADAVEHRGTSFSSFVDGHGNAGENAAHLRVFQRDSSPCAECGAQIVKATQGQRTTYFCPQCQHARAPRG